MQTTQIASIAFSFVSAVAFALVGRAVQRRAVSPELRFARTAFVVFWFGLAAVSLVGGVMTMLGPWLVRDLDLVLALTFVLLLAICGALWGLLTYLVFLYTNSSRASWAIGALYLLIFGFLAYYVLHSRPDHVEFQGWGLVVRYANPITTGPVFWGLILLFLAPEMLGALAYLSLYLRVRDPSQRRRILIVSLSIFAWFGTGFFAPRDPTQPSNVYELVSRLVSLAASGAIYYAFTRLQPGSGEGAATDEAAPAPVEAASQNRSGRTLHA